MIILFFFLIFLIFFFLYFLYIKNLQEFCCLTREGLTKELEKRQSSNTLKVKSLLNALQKTIEFEKEMQKKFSKVCFGGRERERERQRQRQRQREWEREAEAEAEAEGVGGGREV
jgi:hypothetical protein